MISTNPSRASINNSSVNMPASNNASDEVKKLSSSLADVTPIKSQAIQPKVSSSRLSLLRAAVAVLALTGNVQTVCADNNLLKRNRSKGTKAKGNYGGGKGMNNAGNYGGGKGMNNAGNYGGGKGMNNAGNYGGGKGMNNAGNYGGGKGMNNAGNYGGGKEANAQAATDWYAER